MKLRVAVLFIVVLMCTTVFAQSSAPALDAKRQKIVELIKMTGTPDVMVDAIRQQIHMAKKTLPLPPKAQDDFESEFLNEIKVDELVELVVPAYEKYYTEQEIDQLTAFYKSPLGKKMVASLPTMMQEVSRAGGELGAQIGARVGQKIDAKLKAGEYGEWPPKQGSSAQ
ncbi:MAG: DUF2059 domain-containing protein [Acidobacteriaceae bacterium]